MGALGTSIRKVKMATAILILLYSAKRGNLIDVLKMPQKLHSQMLRTVIGQKQHLEWYLLTHPARTIEEIGNLTHPGHVDFNLPHFRFDLARPTRVFLADN